MKKFKKAVTDSEAEVRFDEVNKPGISNLMNIYAAVKSISIEETAKEFENSRYGDFKMAVGNAVVDALTPIREKYNELMNDKGYLDSLFKKNALRAKEIAEPTLKEVYEKIGFIV